MREPDNSMTSEHLHRRLDAALSRTPPILSPDTLKAFVQSCFEQGPRYLSILEDHGAPAYLLDPSVLRHRAGRFRAAFEAVLDPVGFYFAMKSNNHPTVARTLTEARFGLDVSSGLELATALDLEAKDIVFSGPGKTTEELRLAAAHAHRVVVLLDSFGELHRLAQVAGEMRRRVRCGVRLNLNPQGLWRKFGIGMENLTAFFQAAGHLESVELTGLQFHSSWNLSPRPQVDSIETLGRTLGTLAPEHRQAIGFVDIGGGYWPEQGEWLNGRATDRGRLLEELGAPAASPLIHYCTPSAPIEHFAREIAAAVRRHLMPVVSCRIYLEPGRWICNDAMHLLISVVDKKAPDLVITDAGTNAVGWERFESDYFPVLNLSRPAMQERPCHVLGSLCTPHDVWGTSYFGEAIEPGDILMIPTQGAYTYSLRQHFIKPLPPVVVIE
jgi:diaminopimelate decarboxylase